MSDATDTGQHHAQTLDDRVVVLETTERAALVERTSIALTLRIATAVIAFSAAGVIGGAIGPGERFTGRLADERVYDTAKDAAWWAETYARGVGSYEGQ